ncbi:hypothetical protein [uncultured Desulfovibrio sp.]|uniref:hypothetical protein n=1 Tax=uncultured Desulfovibrio sp. TaxID=167968 RepID=UPI002607D967|nr:hypothetical protein [uncultured Desulfovibrio sp.]
MKKMEKNKVIVVDKNQHIFVQKKPAPSPYAGLSSFSGAVRGSGENKKIFYNNML